MLRVTVTGLLAHRLRLVLTAVTVMLGAGLVAGTFILTDSVQAMLRAGTSGPARLVVVQPSGAGGSKGASGPLSVPAGLVTRLRTAGDVAAVQGLITAAKLTYLGPGARPITHARAATELLSYPATPVLAAWYTITAGRAPRRGDEALLDAATARSLGYRPGDRIGVVTPSGTRDLTVTGITGFGGAPSPPDAEIASVDAPTVLVVPPATAQRLVGLPGRFTEIDVLARPGTSATALADRIAPLLPPGIQAVTGGQAASQQAATADSQLDSLRSYLFALCALALAVAGFVISYTFAVLSAQRTREYALLRIIGASRGQVIGSTTGGYSVAEKTMTSRSRGMARWRRVGGAAGATGMVPVGWRPRLSSQRRSVS